MIKLKELMGNTNPEQFSEISDTNKKIWYHGRTVDNESFSLDFVNREESLAQEGPGFYFTNTLSDARRYASPNGVILKCRVKYNKTRFLKTNGKPSENVIRRLIYHSPDKEMSLSNWGENPNEALYAAVNAYLDDDSPASAYQTIWNDFYGISHSSEYLRVLGRYYDGQLIKRTAETFHLILYNPINIKVVDKLHI